MCVFHVSSLKNYTSLRTSAEIQLLYERKDIKQLSWELMVHIWSKNIIVIVIRFLGPLIMKEVAL